MPRDTDVMLAAYRAHELDVLRRDEDARLARLALVAEERELTRALVQHAIERAAVAAVEEARHAW